MTVQRRIDIAPMPLEHMVYYSETGLVTFTWTNPPMVDGPTIDCFVRGLADDDGAMVMSQLFEIWYPADAKSEYERHRDDIGRRFKEWREYRTT